MEWTLVPHRPDCDFTQRSVPVSQPYQARLIVRRDGDALKASWFASGQESEPFALTLPLAPEHLKELRWYIEDYMNFTGHGVRPRARRVETQMKDWGGQLRDALFAGHDGGTVYRELMDAARGGRRALLTLGTTDPEVLGQPWELVRDPRGPLTFQGVTIRRQLVGFTPVADRRFQPPLRVLLIVSRPKDTGFIDPRNSIPPVLDALEALPEGMAEVAFCEPPTLPRLEEMISEARDMGRPFHIVHFDGHGFYLPRTGVGALAFENDQEKTEEVTGTRLGDLLARQAVPLAILEACRGAALRDRPVFGSLAPALLHSGVASVIAFSHSVHLQTGKLFVERFYQKLARGKTVGESLEDARTKLHADRARWLFQGPNPPTVDLEDWFIPQLYQVGDDPALFASVESTAKAARRRRAVSLPTFPAEPMYRFHGRAKELLELERAFRKHAAVVVHGMGGMGKTALSREAAHWWVRTGRFEAAVFFSFEQRHGADSVVKELGKALEGVAFTALPAEEQWRRAVELFQERRVLLVWDNFESTLETFQQGEEVLGFDAVARSEVRRLFQELTSGQPEGRLLVTCRPDDTGLPGIKKVDLHGLARPDSLHLVAAIVDREGIDLERPGYEPLEVDGLLCMLDDHPLSISLVAPHFKSLAPKQVRAEFGPLLAQFANPRAAEDRNKSLLASLEFSKKRLSAEARRMLPYLAWFQGGVHEGVFLEFAEMSAEAWAPVRAELLATALLSVEEPASYLRFHPTLPYAARAEEVSDAEAAQVRFLSVYQAFRQGAAKALRGQNPAAGMMKLAREEANARSALTLAFRRGERDQGGELGGTLREYLERSGRLRERQALVQWVREQFSQDGQLDQATCAALLDHAWSRLELGDAAEAVRVVQGLLQRLQSEGFPDTTSIQTALCQLYLGRIYYNTGRADLAVEPLQQAAAGFERLGEDGRGNLAAALGSLANALRALSRFDEALAASERGVVISREQGNQREIAAGLGRTAAILRAQERYAEAEARYEEALQAARAVGDVSLQGSSLQHQGILHDDQGQHDRTVELYQQALALFQRAGDSAGEMQTCDLLGTAEKHRGQLDAAEAWYLHSRELAGPPRNDRRQLAGVAHNLGILYQNHAQQAGDTAARADWLRQAVASVQESLAIKLDMNDQLNAASAYAQLGVLYQLLQEWDQAETYLRQSLQIYEPLNHPEVWKVYRNLAKVARGRGDAEAAAGWQAKSDAKLAELKRLRRGEGSGAASPRLSEQLMQALLELARACYAARTSKSPLPPQAAEVIAQLGEAPAPFPVVAAFLHAVAANQPVPPVPADLPPQLAELLTALAEAVQA
jgi:tetratricopeptide (TPR) repeat protein